MPEYTIGLDLGGTNLRAAAVDSDGKMLQKIWGSTDLSRGPEAVVEDMAKAIDGLRFALGSQDLQGIGVAVPGFIRLKEGMIAGSNNLAVLEGFPMRDALRARLGTPVILENDANAAAMGEKWMGAGREVDDLVLLTLGTGHRRRHHLRRESAARVPRHGGRAGAHHGGAERKSLRLRQSRVSGKARVGHGDCRAWRWMIGLGDVTSEHVYQLAKAGDERALADIRCSMGQALGIALAMLVNMFNFPLYLISGGPLPAWDIFAPHRCWRN